MHVLTYMSVPVRWQNNLVTKEPILRHFIVPLFKRLPREPSRIVPYWMYLHTPYASERGGTGGKKPSQAIPPI